MYAVYHTYVLSHHLQQHNTHIAHTLHSALYVDNVTGRDTEKYALFNSMLGEARFNLRAWASNRKLLMKIVQQDGTSDEANPVKVLGMCWATTTDHLSLLLKYSTDQLQLDNRSHLNRNICCVFRPTYAV